jgi:hypothetical protein
VHIVTNPDVYTFFFEELFVNGVLVEEGAFEKRPEASVPG